MENTWLMLARRTVEILKKDSKIGTHYARVLEEAGGIVALAKALETANKDLQWQRVNPQEKA